MILCVGIGAFLMMTGLLVPMWRYDKHGTVELEKKYDIPGGFHTKAYGILHIKAGYSKAWMTQAQAACDIRDVSTGLSLLAMAWDTMLLGHGPCSSSEACNIGFTNHAIARCTEYEKMSKLAYVVMTMTFVGVIMLFAGIITVFLSKRRITGGIAVGLWTWGSLLPMIAATFWAIQTDQSFKQMSKSAWYPYPSLHWAFYLFIGGGGLVFICNIIFAVLVCPSVLRFDKAQERLDKKERKIARKVERDKKAIQRQIQLEQLKEQAENPQPLFPPPPGMKGKGKGKDFGKGFGKGDPYGKGTPYGKGDFGKGKGGPPPGYPPQQYGQPAMGESAGLLANQQGAPGGDFGIGASPQRPPAGIGVGTTQSSPASGYWPARSQGPPPSRSQGPPSSMSQPAGHSLTQPPGGGGGGFMNRLSNRMMNGWNTMPGPPPATRPRG